MVGNTNKEEILSDETGNRRWLPVVVGAIDREAVRRDMRQLWAEAAALFVAGGVDWEEAMVLGRGQHAQHAIGDTWQQSVEAWLRRDRDDGVLEAGRGVSLAKWGDGYFTSGDVLTRGVGLRPEGINLQATARAARVMRALGFTTRAVWAEGRTVRRWVRG